MRGAENVADRSRVHPLLRCVQVPHGVDLATSAALPVVYGTADLALRHRAGLRQGVRMAWDGLQCRPGTTCATSLKEGMGQAQHKVKISAGQRGGSMKIGRSKQGASRPTIEAPLRA